MIQTMIAGGQSRTNGSLTRTRDPDPGVAMVRNSAEHQQRADQAELLAEHGEDEVGVGLGQVAPLLLAGADALRRTGRRSTARRGRGPAASRRRVVAHGSVNVVSRVSRSGRSRPARRRTPTITRNDDEQPGRRADHPEHPSRIANSTSAVPRSWPKTTSAGGQEHAGHHRHHHLWRLPSRRSLLA